ncbi:MAG: ABC transporter permease [Candidatus Limnocylindrales bacterium]
MTQLVRADLPDSHQDPHHDGGRRRLNLVSLLTDYAIIWMVLALFILLAVTTPNFISQANLRNILDQQSLVLIAAAAATITMISGGFDISQGAVYVVAPLVALGVEVQTGSLILALLAGLGFGLIAGAINGGVVTVGRINSFIATLATSFVIFGIGFIVSDRSILRPLDRDAFGALARTDIGGITSATVVAIVVVIAAWILLSRTRFGRYVYAVGGNPDAARLAGVRVRWVIVTAFVLSGFAAALAGVLRSSRTMSATPSDDFGFVFDVIAAIVVGGTSIAGGEGSIWRTVLGAFFIAFMINGFNLNQVDPIFQRIIQGSVILLAVALDSWSRSRRA